MHESEQVALMRRVAHIFVTVNKVEPKTADWHVLNMTVDELQHALETNGKFLRFECTCSETNNDMCRGCYEGPTVENAVEDALDDFNYVGSRFHY